MFQNLGGWHLVVILFIILLLFGAPKLPGLAKSLGQSMKILKKEVRTDNGEGAAGDPAADGAVDVSNDARNAQFGQAPAAPAVSASTPAASAVGAVPSETDVEAELARARAEAAAAKAEAEALRAAVEKRSES